MRLIDADALNRIIFEIGCHKTKMHPMEVMDIINNQPTTYNVDKVIHKIHCHYIDRIDDADSEEIKKLQIDNHVVSEIVRNGGKE